MKKILITCLVLFLAQGFIIKTTAKADEIIDSKGNIINCKLETVECDLVEYKKDGSLYMFTREHSSPIFNDYVDVRTNLRDSKSVTRLTGKILIKDMWSTKIKNDNGTIDIPFYRVKFVGIYKPN